MAETPHAPDASSAATKEIQKEVSEILKDPDNHAALNHAHQVYCTLIGDSTLKPELAQHMVAEVILKFANTKLEAVSEPTALSALVPAIRMFTASESGTVNTLKELTHASCLGFCDRTAASRVNFNKNSDGSTSLSMWMPSGQTSKKITYIGRMASDWVISTTPAGTGKDQEEDDKQQGQRTGLGDGGDSDDDSPRPSARKRHRHTQRITQNQKADEMDIDTGSAAKEQQDTGSTAKKKQDTDSTTKKKQDTDSAATARTGRGKARSGRKTRKANTANTASRPKIATLTIPYYENAIHLGKNASKLQIATQIALDKQIQKIQQSTKLSNDQKESTIKRLFNGCVLLQKLFTSDSLQILTDRINALMDWTDQESRLGPIVTHDRLIEQVKAHGDAPEAVKDVTRLVLAQTANTGHAIALTLVNLVDKIKASQRWEYLESCIVNSSHEDHDKIWGFVTDVLGEEAVSPKRGIRNTALLRKAVVCYSYGLNPQSPNFRQQYFSLNNKFSKNLQDSKGLRVFVSRLGPGILMLFGTEGWKESCSVLPRPFMKKLLDDVKRQIPELEDVGNYLTCLVAEPLLRGQYPMINLVTLNIREVKDIDPDYKNWRCLTWQARTNEIAKTGLEFSNETVPVGTRLVSAGKIFEGYDIDKEEGQDGEDEDGDDDQMIVDDKEDNDEMIVDDEDDEGEVDENVEEDEDEDDEDEDDDKDN